MKEDKERLIRIEEKLLFIESLLTNHLKHHEKYYSLLVWSVLSLSIGIGLIILKTAVIYMFTLSNGLFI